MASTRSRRVKKQEDCFGELKEGIQRGLFRLVTDNRSTVAEMVSLRTGLCITVVAAMLALLALTVREGVRDHEES